MEITKKLELNEEQNQLLDLHSLVNVLNILISEIYLLQMEIENEERLDDAAGLILSFSDKVKNKNTLINALEDAPEIKKDILNSVNIALEPLKSNEKVEEALENINSIFEIFDVRVREMLTRLKDDVDWKWHDIQQLKENFLNVFAAIEKNSKGRYRIIYNLAEHDIKDYFVNFDINSYEQDKILMPPVFQDVMRDLIANARKYTEPGGRIMAGLVNDGKFLKFVVEDTGRGIPEHQLENVVDFGFRGDNVMDKATKGGGFGLTKAYWVTKKFDGRFFIKSVLNEGTKIMIKIPVGSN
jgi:signal transduction histidine kinase